MSNNAGPAVDGGEIGRAQVLQALAARVPPSVHMNPVLLKPQSDTETQIIVRGTARGILRARDFGAGQAPYFGAVMESFEKLKHESDMVIVEGAGSPAEINLRAGDIANMGFARPAGVPVLLAGDIDRGGVIASIAGTRMVLDPEDAAMIRGFIINRFRGDISLFHEGIRAIETLSGWRSLGIVPWIPEARNLPEEDAVAANLNRAEGAVIAIPLYPHISNHDDFDALDAEQSLRVVRVKPGEPLPGNAGMIILPGSKTTISDLAFFRAQGWDIDLAAHIRRGGFVLGICGGYQMMGKTIADPEGLEGTPGSVQGLGLLPVHTVLSGGKRVTDVEGTTVAGNVPFRGYEIHNGRTEREAGAIPLLRFAGGKPHPSGPAAETGGEYDGAVSEDGRIAGCYVHRLFDDPLQRAMWIAKSGALSDGIDQSARVEAALDAVAAALAASLDIDTIREIAERG
jgi:adenosylcobyric acid synthase